MMVKALKEAKALKEVKIRTIRNKISMTLLMTKRTTSKTR